jgi:hypothetical protein
MAGCRIKSPAPAYQGPESGSTARSSAPMPRR